MCEQGSKLKQIRLAHTTKSLKTHALVDQCIARIIQMFNDEGYQTVASCCGHGKRPGVITLENGTELILCYSYKQTRMVESLYPGLHEEIDGKTPLPLNVNDYESLVDELESANADLVRKKFIDQEKMEQQQEKLQDLDSDKGALIYDRNHLKDRISELFEENSEMVKKRATDIQKMEAQWEEIQELKAVAIQSNDNFDKLFARTKDLVHDRDGQKAGWDASVKVIDKFILELNDQRKENDDLKEETKDLEKENEALENEVQSYMKTVEIYRDVNAPDELNNIEEMKKDLACCQESESDLANQLKEVQAERDSLRVTIGALRTASRFKKEYDPKWQNEVIRLENIIRDNNESTIKLEAINADLKKEPERIHGHWHKQTNGYMNKIKNQRRQLKEYQKCKERLTNRINTLYPYIAHGPMDHRKWLRKAIDDHFDMNKNAPAPKMSMETKTFNQGGFFKEGDI